MMVRQLNGTPKFPLTTPPVPMNHTRTLQVPTVFAFYPLQICSVIRISVKTHKRVPLSSLCFLTHTRRNSVIVS